MRIATPTLAILAATAGLAAGLAVPASAAQASATGARDCTKPDAIAKLNNYSATVNKAAVQDADGYHKVTAGQTMVMGISGTLSEAVKGGKAHIEMTQPGQTQPLSGDVDMAQIFASADAKPIEFPVAAGPFTWYLPATMSEDMAPGRYMQKLDVANEAGRQIMCFEVAFQVAPKAAAAPAG